MSVEFILFGVCVVIDKSGHNNVPTILECVHSDRKFDLAVYTNVLLFLNFIVGWEV